MFTVPIKEFGVLFLILLLKWNIGDTNTKLFELVECPDFICRETGDLEGKDKIGKVQRAKVYQCQIRLIML